jgi:hypothetical protein
MSLSVGPENTRLIRHINQLQRVIWERLRLHGDLKLRLNWLAHWPEPKRLLLSKIGFIHAVLIVIWDGSFRDTFLM